MGSNVATLKSRLPVLRNKHATLKNYGLQRSAEKPTSAA
jgi:hypothetical protein